VDSTLGYLLPVVGRHDVQSVEMRGLQQLYELKEVGEYEVIVNREMPVEDGAVVLASNEITFRIGVRRKEPCTWVSGLDYRNVQRRYFPDALYRGRARWPKRPEAGTQAGGPTLEGFRVCLETNAKEYERRDIVACRVTLVNTTDVDRSMLVQYPLAGHTFEVSINGKPARPTSFLERITTDPRRSRGTVTLGAGESHRFVVERLQHYFDMSLEGEYVISASRWVRASDGKSWTRIASNSESVTVRDDVSNDHSQRIRAKADAGD
jgi:hypothetical protein